MKIGIIGSSSAGKTTLLALLTGLDYATLSSAQASGKIRTGIIHVPDQRLRTLGTQIDPEKKLVSATLEGMDTTALGLVPNLGSTETGYDKNREHLAILRELDGIICVSKSYQGDQGNLAPAINIINKEIDDIKSELLLSDLEIIEKRIKKLEHQVQKPTPTLEHDKKELSVLCKLQQAISTEVNFVSFRREIETHKSLYGYGFLCLKPFSIVLNIAESDIGPSDKFAEIKRAYSYCISACLKLEYELKQLPPEEVKEFMHDYGITQLMTNEIIKTCYQALGLISFFTIGKNEIRAWSIKHGDNVVTAASKVHTDMARGFISAEVVSFQDWLSSGSLKAVKEHGKIRLEGKNYIVNDGDIINFRFNI